MDMVKIDVVNIEKKHLDAMISLFIDQYDQTRCQFPELPENYQTREGIRPYISWVVHQCTGVAALINGELVGYMSALMLEPFKSPSKGAYTPEFAHAAQALYRNEIYDALRETLWRILAQVGCENHCVELLENDISVKSDFFVSGYGMLVADALASTESLLASTHKLPKNTQDYHVRRVNPSDRGKLAHLVEAYEAFMTSSPVFLYSEPDHIAEKMQRWEMDGKRHTWVVEHLPTGELIGFANGVQDAENTCHILHSKHILGISGTYILPEHRQQQVATLLFHEMTRWAMEQGYTHVSVNFETANHQGRRFWTKHFKVISVSLIRHIDGRVFSQR